MSPAATPSSIMRAVCVGNSNSPMACVKAKTIAPNIAQKGIRLIKRIPFRSEEHTSELQSRFELVCRLLLEKNKAATVPNMAGHVTLVTKAEFAQILATK